ncbi:MAG: lipocalin family protein [Treponema sp.]
MNKFLRLNLLILLVLVCFFSCKNANNAKNCEEKRKSYFVAKTDEEVMSALVGTWQIVSEFQEGKGHRVYPIHPKPHPHLDSYVLFAFGADGNFHMATRSINKSNGEIYLLWQKDKDAKYSIKGNKMVMTDKNGSENAFFTLRNNYLTTFVKDSFGKLQTRDFKKVESPTIDEILKAPTE